MKIMYSEDCGVSAQKAKTVTGILFSRFGMCILLMLLVACVSAQTNNTTRNKATYTYKIIAAQGNTFGYDIYNNGVLIVHQPTIPGKQGWLAFSTKQLATEAAIKAIAERQTPPSENTNAAADKPTSK